MNALNMAGQPDRTDQADQTSQADRLPRIRQGWLRLIIFGIGFTLITLLLAIPAVILVAGVKIDDLKTNLVGSLAGQLSGSYLWLMIVLECLISVISVWIFRTFIDRRTLSSLGLSFSGWTTESLLGLLLGPALLGIPSLALLLTGHLRWVDADPAGAALPVSLGMMVFIAVGEELVFRGYVLRNLLDSLPGNSTGKWTALAISSLLFSLFHVTNPGMNTVAFANIFMAGMLLGINYIYTGNLWFSFLFHLSWNFFQGPLLGFRVSGLNLPSLFIIETKGDSLLTGGDFGLEGSILYTATSIIALVLLAQGFRYKYAGSPSPITIETGRRQ